jgi:hypothetical protein
VFYYPLTDFIAIYRTESSEGYIIDAMDDLKEQALDLQAEVEAAAERIDIDTLVQQKLALDRKWLNSRPS